MIIYSYYGFFLDMSLLNFDESPQSSKDPSPPFDDCCQVPTPSNAFTRVGKPRAETGDVKGAFCGFLKAENEGNKSFLAIFWPFFGLLPFCVRPFSWSYLESLRSTMGFRVVLSLFLLGHQVAKLGITGFIGAITRKNMLDITTRVETGMCRKIEYSP